MFLKMRWWFLIQITLVRSNPKSEEFERTFKDSHRVFKKYQMTIHKEDEHECDEASFVDFLVKSPLEVQFCQSFRICRH